MNALIVAPSEIKGDLVKVPQERVMQDIGFELPLGVLGGGRYWSRIESKSEKFVIIRVLRELPLFPRLDVDLAVGLSRPQTIKKVISLAVQTGVRSLSLISSDRGEKSYISSHLLRPDQLEREVIKSLEQTGDSIPTKIEIYKSWDIFLKDRPEENAFLLSPQGSRVGEIKTPALVCIGPEAGFSKREEQLMASFNRVKISDRVLRVETAVGIVLGKVA
jgi:RsmE family RNA methyltransferase